MINKIFKKIQNEKGIGLVELVVAVAIFSLVMLAATGIFINAMKAQKAIIAKQNVANNMRYVMEFMAKEMRMAQVPANSDLTFNDGAGVPSKLDGTTVDSINFYITAALTPVTYLLDNEKVKRKLGAGGNEPISSEEILITGLSFKINSWYISPDTVPNPRPAPLITIFMKAKAKNGAGGEVELQTSIAPRTY